MALENLPLDSVHPGIPEAIQRLRTGQVIRTPGYDGVYGSIRLFDRENSVP